MQTRLAWIARAIQARTRSFGLREFLHIRPFSFRPEARLKKSSEFACLQKEGRKLYSKHFLLIIAEGKSLASRLGITITVKVDRRATARNRIKRRLREVFRKHAASLKGVFDIVAIARQGSPLCTYQDIEREFVGTLRHHGYISRKSSVEQNFG